MFTTGEGGPPAAGGRAPPKKKNPGSWVLGLQKKKKKAGLRPAGGAGRLAGPGYTYVLGFLAQT